MAYSLRTKKTWQETMNDLRETFRLWAIDRWSVFAGVAGQRRSTAYYQTKEQRRVELRYQHPSGQDVILVKDSQDRDVDNLRVLYLAVEAIRLNEVRGIGDVVREAYLQLAAPARERDPWEVLGIRSDTPLEDAEAMYRIKAKRLHPDTGNGDEAGMRELNNAMDRIRAEKA